MINNDFKSVFPRFIRDEFLFDFDSYQSFLEGLNIDPILFLEEWSNFKRESIIEGYWQRNTHLDWKWSLSFPIFSLLEEYLKKCNYPKIIGFSGLPGSGKSTLGSWINNVAKDLNLDIKVISLDDFYLPGIEMDIAMHGNPWNVPRGFPGSHSLDLLNYALDTFMDTGILKSPHFDKSLRDGKGDRSGWMEINTKIIILEGWFVGCEPISDFPTGNIYESDDINLSLTYEEKKYRNLIQSKLLDYSKIWNKFDKIVHLKSTDFNNTIQWKTQQELEMLKMKGSALIGKNLADFIRMIQSSIPQHSLSSINSDTTIEINASRRIVKLYTKDYLL